MDKGHQEALRSAARQLVREKGLSRTTTRDLAGASGANLRSIGYHFGSKDALMAEILGQICAEWTAIGVDASRSGGPQATPGERMTSAVRTMLTDLADKRADLFVVLEGIVEARHNATLSASLIATQATSQADVADSLLEGAPELSREVALQVARLLMAVHDGLVLQLAVTDTPALHDVESLVLALAGLGVTLAAGLGVPGAAQALSAMLET